MPAAMFCIVPCSASPIARPAAPSTATMLAVSMPSCDSAPTIATMRMPHTATSQRIGRSVSSTRSLFESRRFSQLPMRFDSHQPTTSNARPADSLRERVDNAFHRNVQRSGCS